MTGTATTAPADEAPTSFRYAIDDVCKLAALGSLTLEVITTTGQRYLGTVSWVPGDPEEILRLDDAAIIRDDIVELRLSAGAPGGRNGDR